jgi:hypothetical protein
MAGVRRTHVGVHYAENSLAQRYRPTFHVLIGVLIGARPVRRGNVSQWLEVSEVEVKLVVQRGS